ncbi:Gluconate transport-inducing protein required for gluconate-H+ symport [Didymosphaeria variabile]|uniref:Gluconate transport-inducing protein required for gluconate-H+ symport n=1 Tax=Didymosphaeria variabile TaxID=1932322 RepID=A0A9W8XLW6_9PLEO|nr:Gluconate transport-inducing protein required for gluconate-H+ symport [Didymosphaeria variabile]KAJ4353944.1 Gluconate transport-inducing protein required for gluconate-H+ symport [Didymosphaeria variabile]
MAPFGHDSPLGGPQKLEGYGDTDAWQWPQPATQASSYTPIFDHSVYAHLNSQQPGPLPVARHHSIATSHVVTQGRATPPSRSQLTGAIVKAQPAFKPTWHGFLDTTKDAMTIVEAALQGRLGHISRRPHDKERAEMLTSGTVLVYEENASGIRRWTDAVHWSPSRVMNNCLIYRQLTRALKPEEKRSALNPSCNGKRKRKESAGHAATKALENVSDDEYDNPVFQGAVAGDVTPVEPSEKVYANFAQSLTPDQQRRFCGSLIDSYEFKEGGLMKKTISVKYQGTNHHIISYYTLEDVVHGKLKRPCEDPDLRDIQPRPDLLTGWKVSLEDEESKEQPQYPTHMPVAHHPQTGLPPQIYVQIPGSWHGNQVSQYSSPQSAHPYPPPQVNPSQYIAQPSQSQYPVQHHSPQHYSPQVPRAPQQYSQTASSHHLPAQHGSVQRYPSPASLAHQYSPHAQQSTQYPPAQQSAAPQQYGPPATVHYPTAPQEVVPQAPPYAMSQTQVVDYSGQGPLQQHSVYRRTSAPMVMQQPYDHPAYPSAPQAHPSTYYVTDAKYTPNQSFEY